MSERMNRDRQTGEIQKTLKHSKKERLNLWLFLL